jgi:predicted nuclease of restriction endonuclease-like RecB superfamily
MNILNDKFLVNETENSRRESINIEDKSNIFDSRKNSNIFDSRKNSILHDPLNFSRYDDDANQSFYKKKDSFSQDLIDENEKYHSFLNLENNINKPDFSFEHPSKKDNILIEQTPKKNESILKELNGISVLT